MFQARLIREYKLLIPFKIYLAQWVFLKRSQILFENKYLFLFVSTFDKCVKIHFFFQNSNFYNVIGLTIYFFLTKNTYRRKLHKLNETKKIITHNLVSTSLCRNKVKYYYPTTNNFCLWIYFFKDSVMCPRLYTWLQIRNSSQKP